MKHITNDQFVNNLKICQKGKHKLRENNFGVVFCTRCGLLSTSVGAVEKLTEDDKIKVVKYLVEFNIWGDQQCQNLFIREF